MTTMTRPASSETLRLQTAEGKTVEIPSDAALQRLTQEFHECIDRAIQNDEQELLSGLSKAQLGLGCGGLNRQEAEATIGQRIATVRGMVDEIQQISSQNFEPLTGSVPLMLEKSIGWSEVNSDLKATEEKVHTLGLSEWTGAGGDAYRQSKSDQLDDITAQRVLSEHNTKALDSVALLQAMLLVAFHDQLEECAKELREVADIPQQNFFTRRQAKSAVYFRRLGGLYCILFDHVSRLRSLDHGALFEPVDECQQELSVELEGAAKDAMQKAGVKQADYSEVDSTKVDSGTNLTWQAHSEEDLRDGKRVSRRRIAFMSLFG